MKEWIGAQGGDVSYIEEPDRFPKTAYAVPVLAEESGYIAAMDAEAIGTTAVILGAGRNAKEDVIDYSAGIIIKKKTGDKAEKGETLAILYTNKEASIEPARERYLSALKIADTRPTDMKLIYDIIR
jgi:pyrimidine-nucleoside phosphorylase